MHPTQTSTEPPARALFFTCSIGLKSYALKPFSLQEICAEIETIFPPHDGKSGLYRPFRECGFTAGYLVKGFHSWKEYSFKGHDFSHGKLEPCITVLKAQRKEQLKNAGSLQMGGD